jgi:hypothetical protein
MAARCRHSRVAGSGSVRDQPCRNLRYTLDPASMPTKPSPAPPRLRIDLPDLPPIDRDKRASSASIPIAA